jgi:hypothetical protein
MKNGNNLSFSSRDQRFFFLVKPLSGNEGSDKRIRGGVKFFLISLEADETVFEKDHPIGHDLDTFQIVSHHDRGQLFLSVQLAYQSAQ